MIKTLIGNLASKTPRQVYNADVLVAPVLTKLGYGLNSISIMWDAVPYATGYEVQRATDSGFTTGLTTLYAGNAAGVTEQYQPGYTLKYHDSGLSAGTTYYYRCRATGPGLPSSYSATKTIATGTANKTATITGPATIVEGSEDEFQWFNGVSTVNVHGGDTIAIANAVSGYWQYLLFINYNGTPTEPVTMRNQGQVVGPAMSFLDCSYINADFSHASKVDTEGMEIVGFGGGECVNIYGLSHHISIKYLKTRGGGYSLRLKNEANTFTGVNPGCGIHYMWPSHMHNIEIAYWNAAQHSQDGFYIGSSAPWGGRTFVCSGNTVDYRPTGLADIHFHHNNMSYCGRSGFQLGCLDLGVNRFNHNTIFECGFEYAADQGAGMAIGGANNSLEIDHNTIYRTYREPVYTYNYGEMYIHDNDFDEAGVITVEPFRTFFWNKITLNPGQTLSGSWDGVGGATIIDSNGEYYFEFFTATGLERMVKMQRIYDKYSSTEVAIPTSHPTTVNLTTSTGLTYTGGQVLTVVNNIDQTKYFTATVTSYNSGTGALVLSSTSNTGTGTFRNWVMFKTTRSPQQAIADTSLTAPGSHAGNQADPYVGFGASSAITTGQVSYPTEVSIPGGFAVGNFLMNCFSDDSVDIYGTPAGLTRFRIENNIFGTQQAASSKVISFLNSNNLYGTGNTICGNTYLGSPVIEGNITKPGGGVVTYALNTTCP